MPKRTYQPSKKKRMTTHGFLARKNSPKGSNILKARRQKGRVRLAVKPSVKPSK
ncbi:50S ribosomal protein L34 [Candidatus Nomurabacteria bacterium]|nr:50S ribosomal protein L34 [Candidatus Nomurabacteria bacterium]MCB9819611.1 50S ribosomal protein L34 [Candidatus Nomurabacteria bacterium]